MHSTFAAPARPVLIEACVTTPAEATAAARAGAYRLELCRDLETGGLTPDRDLVTAARDGAGIPVFAMVRPRAGSFVAQPGEGATMLAEIAALRALGIDGLVLGVLDRSARIDVALLRELVAAATGLPVTFHRAFDRIPDPLAALETLAELGVRRVLTSGGAPTAWEGRAVLRDLVRASQHGVTILAGGAVRADHVRELVAFAALEEVHARAAAIPDIIHALAP